MNEIATYWSNWKLQLSQNAASDSEQIAAFCIVLLLAALVQFIYSKWIKHSIVAAISKTTTKWDDYLFNDKVFAVLGRFIPVAIIYYLLPYSICDKLNIYIVVNRVLKATIIMLVAASINSILTGVNDKIKTHDGVSRPTTGIFQMLKLIVWCIAALLAIAIIFDRNPQSMLTGIGASAAVLMLVFQDTIIGLVAGVQLAAYDMIHKGDWVVMEKNNINGIVVDVNLNTVKVRNWDYSIVTVPPHALMTESFNNYRNMRHAKARRITIKLMLDSRTVVEAEEQLMKKLSEKGMLVDSKDLPGTVDDPILTNLHLFSMYVEQYMMNLPHVNVRGLLMVRIGAPTAQGLPVEAYCHINKVDWKPFEQAHARLVEHLLAVLPYFGLSVFQSPTDTSINKKI